MATSTKVGVALKLVYTLGMDGDKAITKSKTINNINQMATEDDLHIFGQAMIRVQEYPATITKIDSSELTE